MPKTDITQYDATPANNTDVDGIDIDENCAAGNINNALRAIMSHLAEFADGTTTITSLLAAIANIDNVRIDGNTISTTDTGGTLTIAPDTTGNINLQTDRIVVSEAGEAFTLSHAADNQFMIISGADGGVVGGNLVLYGDQHASLPSNVLIRRDATAAIKVDGATGDVTIYQDDGTTPGVVWDASADELTITGLVIIDNLSLDGNTLSSIDTDGNIILAPNGTGDVLVQTDRITVGEAGASVVIEHVAADQAMILTGDTSSILGGNILLYGGSHASKGSDITLRRDALPVAEVDGDTGDLSLFEDDGATVSVFFDASLGIFDVDNLSIAGVPFATSSFTPTLEPGAGAFSVLTYDQQNGFVTPLGGELAFISIQLRTNAIDVGTASGTLTINGAPNNANTFGQPLNIGFRGTWGNKPERALIDTSGDISLYQSDDSAVGAADLDFTGTLKNQIFISGIYHI